MQAKLFFRCVLNKSVPPHSDYVYPILLLSFEGHLMLFWLTKAAWIPVWEQLLLTDICASSHILQELSADQIHYSCNFLLHQYVTQVQTLGLRKVPIGVSVIQPLRRMYHWNRTYEQLSLSCIPFGLLIQSVFCAEYTPIHSTFSSLHKASLHFLCNVIQVGALFCKFLTSFIFCIFQRILSPCRLNLLLFVMKEREIHLPQLQEFLR